MGWALSAAAGLAIGLAAAGSGSDGSLHWAMARRAQAQPGAQSAAPAAAASTSAPKQEAPKQEWSGLPTMLLEKMYRGPLRDTVIQRWRDPIDGSVCYLYIPISAPLLPPTADGYVQYGPNQIGSISCIHPTQVLQLWQGGGAPPVPPPREPEERAAPRKR
jgi:hypothetical protein